MLDLMLAASDDPSFPESKCLLVQKYILLFSVFFFLIVKALEEMQIPFTCNLKVDFKNSLLVMNF